MTKKLIILILKVLSGLVVFSLLWFGLNRIFASGTAIQTIELPSVAEHRIENGTLKIGAYNIAHGRGGKLGESNWTSEIRKAGEAHLLKIAEQIKKANLDLVVLNEVDFDANWSGGFNQALFIAEAAGYRYVSTLTNIDIDLPFFDLKFGNAILSRLPFRGVTLIELPPVKWWEPILAGKKNAMTATIDFNGMALQFVPIHIETRSYETRIGSVASILAQVQNSSTPAILLGDFNSQRTNAGNSAVDILLEQHGYKTDVSIDNWKTFPSENPNRGIDWILAPSNLGIQNTQAIPSNLSDHLMIAADLDP